jgi:hypothetical protein
MLERGLQSFDAFGLEQGRSKDFGAIVTAVIDNSGLRTCVSL